MRFRILAAALAIAAASVVDAQQPAPQKSVQNGVTVQVTAPGFSAGEWAFKVVLDTHSQELSDDLVATAVLVDPEGRETKPLAWEGAGPSGHHREGVLKFPALQPTPAAVELQIRRAGEAAPRVFKFDVK